MNNKKPIWYVSGKLPNGWYVDQVARTQEEALKLIYERFLTVRVDHIKQLVVPCREPNTLTIPLLPGEPVCQVGCPCCGASLSIEIGDDDGFSVIGEKVEEY